MPALKGTVFNSGNAFATGQLSGSGHSTSCGGTLGSTAAAI